MKKPKKLYDQWDYQWARVKRWLSTFPVPPTRTLLLLILIPLPLVVFHTAIKRFVAKARKLKHQDPQRKWRLTPLQRALLLKSLRKKHLQRDQERERSLEKSEPGDKDV
jgi:hypothetical protein